MIFRHGKNLAWRQYHDRTVIISTENKISTTHLLDGLAKHIWELCDGKLSVEKISHHLVKKYDCPWEELNSDIYEFLNDLKSKKLVEEVHA